MEIRIGIVDTPSVLEIELAQDADREGIKKDIESKVGQEGTNLWLTDRRGKDVCIPAARIGFIEISSADEERRIGFGA